MRIEYEVKLDFKDVLIRPKRSTLRSRSEVEVKRTYVTKHSKKTLTSVPIIAANMDTTGTFEMAVELAKAGVLTAIHKHYTVEQWKSFAASEAFAATAPFIAVSAGSSESDFKLVSEVVAECKQVEMICLDVANGYSEAFVEAVRKYREAFPTLVIMAGNVVTGEMVEELVLSGADIVKVGIGPGSVCTTRKKAGVGYPQLSAVIECADAAHGLGALIVSDGGCTNPGDVAKAFGAGADFVMLGGMLAGHTESGGELVEKAGADGTVAKYKAFYGMSSSVAMTKHHGGVAEYRASEGKAVLCPFRGPVAGTLADILGGLRSACTYVGASCLKDLSKRTTFIRVTQQTNDIFGQEKN